MYYIGDKQMMIGVMDNTMEHLKCFAGGLFAIASQYVKGEERNEFLRIAKGISKFCHLMYTRNPTGLPTEYVKINEEDKIESPDDDNPFAKHYLMRPEAVESWFILYRITKDPIYREWGWQFFQSIELHTRGKFGYSGLIDATHQNPEKDDVQQSYFLSETLKYLYLLFSPDYILPLDKYVFNTEAHPLPLIEYPIHFNSSKYWMDDKGFS